MKNVLHKMLKHSEIYVKENAPTILTCLGAVGVVATSVSAAKSYKKYEQLLAEIQEDREDNISITDKIKVAIPTYAPTVFLGLTTMGCIFGSNILNKKKQAAITSAYMLLDTSYKEYKNKVKELYGDDADDRVMKEIARDKYEVDEETLKYGEKRLFFEPISRTYFEATMGEVEQAEYLLNRELALTDFVRINDFLRYLGVDKTDIGDVMGWSTFGVHTIYGYCWIDFKHELVELEDGLECYIIKYPQEPRLDFMDY